jgi:CDP-diacylglycerol--glycerol-3-phosphate 3-phosphatidyltransferase
MLLANKLSCVRIFFSPVFFVSYIAARKFSGASLFIFCALTAALIFVEFTDFLDGYYARKLNQVSDTGKLLDPFADVLLHLSTFFCFTLAGAMPSYIFLLIVYREFGMLFLRMLSLKKGLAIAASMGGKLKTVLYISSGFYSLALDIYNSAGLSFLPLSPFYAVRTALFLLCAAAAYLSFADYIIRFRKIG